MNCNDLEQATCKGFKEIICLINPFAFYVNKQVDATGTFPSMHNEWIHISGANGSNIEFYFIHC